MKYPMNPFFLSTIGKRFANPNAMYVELTFNSTPTLTLSKAPLLYNKKFAFNFRLDDGLQLAFKNSFAVFKGGVADQNSVVHDGLRYTDGCGNDVMFVADYATELADENGVFVPNEQSLSYIKKSQFDLSKDFGYGILYHSCKPATIVGAYTTYQEFLDDLNLFISFCEQYWDFRPRISTTPGAFVGDNMAYLQNIDGKSPSFDSGHWGSLQRKGETGDPTGYRTYAGTLKPLYISEGLPVVAIGKTYFESGGWYPCGYATSHVSSEMTMQNIKDMCTQLYNDTVNRAWGFFTHNLTYASDEGDRGGLTMTDFIDLFSWIESNYGKSGNDSIWMASSNSVIEYIYSREYSEIKEYHEGNTVILEIIPPATELRRPAITLNFNSNIAPTAINIYNIDRFSSNILGNTSGIINLEWSNEFYDVANRYVTQAQSTRLPEHIEYAQYLTNAVSDQAKHDTLQSKINNIEPLEATVYYIDFGMPIYAATAPFKKMTSYLTTDPPIQLLDHNSILTDVYMSTVVNFYERSSYAQNDPSKYPPDALYVVNTTRDGFKSTPGGADWQTVPKTCTLLLTGLDPTRYYDFDFYLCRQFAERPTTLRVYNNRLVTPSTEFDESLLVPLNKDNFTRLDRISNARPTPEGDLWIDVTAAGTSEGIINALTITAKITSD